MIPKVLQSRNVLFILAFSKLGFVMTDLIIINTTLTDLIGNLAKVIGSMDLHLELGIQLNRKVIIIKFLVVDLPLAYNPILGQPILLDSILYARRL